MRYVARAGGLRSPKSANACRIYNLWIGGSGWLAVAHDRYLDCAATCKGGVLLLEYLGIPVGGRLAEAGIGAVSVCESCQAENVDGKCQRVVCDSWSSYSAATPAGLVMAPLGGIESVWSREERQRLFERVNANLSRGGRFLFDAKYWGVSPCDNLNGLSRLALDERGADGTSLLIWETWRNAGVGKAAAELTLALETVCPDGVVKKKKYARFLRAVLDPTEVREDLISAGFAIDGVYGGFAGEPLEEGAATQFWSASKISGEARS